MKVASRRVFGRTLRDLHGERRVEGVWLSANAYGGMVSLVLISRWRMRRDSDPTAVFI